nr:hypothetical protein CFP56_77804 [Quercus suber]
MLEKCPLIAAINFAVSNQLTDLRPVSTVQSNICAFHLQCSAGAQVKQQITQPSVWSSQADSCAAGPWTPPTPRAPLETPALIPSHILQTDLHLNCATILPLANRRTTSMRLTQALEILVLLPTRWPECSSIRLLGVHVTLNGTQIANLIASIFVSQIFQTTSNMQPITAFLAMGALSLAGAAPSAVAPRNSVDDPLYVEFWKEGCGIYGTGYEETWTISTEGPTYPGDCFRAPFYNFKSIQITQDSAASYSIDVFNGEACDGHILVRLLFTQPDPPLLSTKNVESLTLHVCR